MSVEMKKLILPDQNGNDQEFEVVDEAARSRLDGHDTIIATKANASDLASEIDARTNNDAVLSARMDTFTNLPSGSTSGDAELIDIRVGADGITYPTAGDAVRGQVNGLKEETALLVDSIVGVNLFDGNFDESGYIDSNGADVSSANFKRTSNFYPIVGDRSNGYLYFYSATQGAPIGVNFYDENKESTHEYGFNNLNQGYVQLQTNDVYFRVYVRTAYNGDITLSLTMQNEHVPYEKIKKIKENIIDYDNLATNLQRKLKDWEAPIYIQGIPNTVLTGFYLLDNSYTPYGVYAESDNFRMKLKDSNGTIISNGVNVASEYYSDKIQRFVDHNTGNIIAYYVLHYTGTDYTIDSNNLTFTSDATSLDNNALISEYLNRDKNLVLIGDSLFGYASENVLEACLSTISSKQVFNCGFGGCTMAWRSANGSDPYDEFSFPSVIDSILNDNYSGMITNMELNYGYPYRIASLKSIDWTKPTTILINYVNNDIATNVPIGDLWNYTDGENDFDKHTVLGAFNYGLKKLLTEYPHINIVQFTSAWRKLGTNNKPPYAYKNTLNLSPYDYDDAIKENADRQGIAIYDYFKNGGRNWYNAEAYQQDATHYNAKGFALFAKILDALDKSYID